MDGVLVHEEHPLDGARAFLDGLRRAALPLLVRATGVEPYFVGKPNP